MHLHLNTMQLQVKMYCHESDEARLKKTDLWQGHHHNHAAAVAAVMLQL